jgi:hypothetical protein
MSEQPSLALVPLTPEPEKEITITIRVPAKRTDPTVTRAKALAVHLVNRSADVLDADTQYREALTGLKGMIEHDFGSTAKFCEAAGIDKFNLSKVWPAENKAGKKQKKAPAQDMSLGLYLRICISLGLIDSSAVTGDSLDFKMSLKEYLRIDNNAVLKSMMFLNRLS